MNEITKEFVKLLLSAVVGAITASAGTLFIMGQQIARLETQYTNVERRLNQIEPQSSMQEGKAPARAIGKTDSSEQTLSSRLIVTTGINSKKNPSNNLSRVPLSKKKVYFFATWFGLKPQEIHTVTWELRDETQSILVKDDFSFTPTKEIYNTWRSYTFKPNVDQPGVWRIIVYLNNKRLAERTFTVEKI